MLARLWHTESAHPTLAVVYPIESNSVHSYLERIIMERKFPFVWNANWFPNRFVLLAFEFLSSAQRCVVQRVLQRLQFAIKRMTIDSIGTICFENIISEVWPSIESRIALFLCGLFAFYRPRKNKSPHEWLSLSFVETNDVRVIVQYHALDQYIISIMQYRTRAAKTQRPPSFLLFWTVFYPTPDWIEPERHRNSTATGLPDAGTSLIMRTVAVAWSRRGHVRK